MYVDEKYLNNFCLMSLALKKKLIKHGHHDHDFELQINHQSRKRLRKNHVLHATHKYLQINWVE